MKFLMTTTTTSQKTSSLLWCCHDNFTTRPASDWSVAPLIPRSDWSIQVTWPQHWPLIGQDSCSWQKTVSPGSSQAWPALIIVCSNQSQQTYLWVHDYYNLHSLKIEHIRHTCLFLLPRYESMKINWDNFVHNQARDCYNISLFRMKACKA